MFITVIGPASITIPSGNYTMVAMPWPLPWPPPPVPQVYEDTFNPKMWAQWFREFLNGHLPKRIESVGVASTIRLVYGAVARSRPLRQREWKMKLWKQAL